MDDIVRAILDNRDKSFAIIAHSDPDGDALGSALGLTLGLIKLGINAAAVCEHGVPFSYRLLPRQELLKKPGDADRFDVCVAVDCAEMNMMGSAAKLLETAQVSINIDHHKSNTGFLPIHYVDISSASNSEIILELLKALKVDLDADIASCLYTGICADTGNFSFSNTCSKTFEAAAELLKYQIDVVEITNALFRTRSLGKTRLIGIAINNLELYFGSRLAIMEISGDEFTRSGAMQYDFEGVIDYARDIDGVIIAILMRQAKTGEYKVSMRSNSDIDVSALAAKFGGGGHQKAAGCTIKGDPESIRTELLEGLRPLIGDKGEGV